MQASGEGLGAPTAAPGGTDGTARLPSRGLSETHLRPGASTTLRPSGAAPPRLPVSPARGARGRLSACWQGPGGVALRRGPVAGSPCRAAAGRSPGRRSLFRRKVRRNSRRRSPRRAARTRVTAAGRGRREGGIWGSRPQPLRRPKPCRAAQRLGRPHRHRAVPALPTVRGDGARRQSPGRAPGRRRGRPPPQPGSLGAPRGSSPPRCPLAAAREAVRSAARRPLRRPSTPAQCLAPPGPRTAGLKGSHPARRQRWGRARGRAGGRRRGGERDTAAALAHLSATAPAARPAPLCVLRKRRLLHRAPEEGPAEGAGGAASDSGKGTAGGGGRRLLRAEGSLGGGSRGDEEGPTWIGSCSASAAQVRRPPPSRPGGLGLGRWELRGTDRALIRGRGRGQDNLTAFLCAYHDGTLTPLSCGRARCVLPHRSVVWQIASWHLQSAVCLSYLKPSAKENTEFCTLVKCLFGS